MNNPTYIQTASIIFDSLVAFRKVKQCEMLNKMDAYNENCQTIRKDIRQYSLAIAKGWNAAAERVKNRLIRNLTDHKLQLERFSDYLNINIPAMPKLKDVYDEIIQLELEYEYLEVSDTYGKITVLTNNIELEGFYFGCFKIELNLKHISKINSESPYRIIAQSPCPASSDSEVTHPHVHSNRLCEGDGFNSIRNALIQGRLIDFFTIVENILNTYNPESPYVSLDDWDGISCYSCGYSVSGDDCYYCECCDNDFCSECSTYCKSCDITICDSCAYHCANCEDSICEECREICLECANAFCSDCIDKDGYCKTCADMRKEKENEKNNIAI